MLARRAASSLAAAAIARPAAACLLACGSSLETKRAAISTAPDSDGTAAPPRLSLTGLGSSGGLWGSKAIELQPSSALQLALMRSISTASSKGVRLSSSSSSGSEDRSGLSSAQLQAAAQRLMRLSRDDMKQPQKSSNTDESMRQRMTLLLRLGFSQASIENAMQRQGGGPYIAEQHIGEAVTLLRRWGFSHQQLDAVLARTNAFARSAADIEAVLAWLQREFGMRPSEAVQACSKAPELLSAKQATLEASWRAFEAELQPTAVARKAVATALRAGKIEFLTLQTETVRQKVAQLRQLFHVADQDMPRLCGHMARLCASDVSGTLQPRLAFLQALTGVPSDKLASRVLPYATLLALSEALLQRKRDALVATMGAEAAQAMLRDSAAGILSANPKLAKLDMQSEAAAAKLSSRVAFWQQAYQLPTAGDAAVKYAGMLHMSLRTVAPRVAFFQQQRPGQPLPSPRRFQSGDKVFCQERGFDPAQFAAFKAAWLASEEGRAVCWHEAAK